MSDAETPIQDEQDEAHLQEELDFSFLNDAQSEDLSQPSDEEVQEVFSAPDEDHGFETDSEFVETAAYVAEDYDDHDAFAEEESVWESAPEASPLVDSSASAAPEAIPAPTTPVDEFNLSTLNQLVDEIRQESQRVTDMKASVVKALALIQEMSESLKS